MKKKKTLHYQVLAGMTDVIRCGFAVLAIILLLLKKRWEAVVFVTAVFGALFWGYAAVENVPLSYLPMVTKLFYVLVPVWCIFVTGYCYKRWSGTVNFLE